ncbi:MFS transporter [Candidatus Micrarchaeota archaeon]|nr:MFS transporter [Candidatus Micrarchaeota archaeon]
MKEKKVNSLARVFLLWSLGIALANAMLYPYLLEIGFTTLDILVFFSIAYLVPSLSLLLVGKMNAEKALLWGLGATGVGWALLGVLGGYAGLGAMLLLGGMAFVFFWVPFNALWFEEGKWGNAFQGAVYYGIMVVIGILGPALGGVVVDYLGYVAVFLLAGAIMVLAGGVSRKVWKGKEVLLGAKKGLEAVSGLKTLFFLEGSTLFGIQVLIFVVTLEYFTKPLEYGVFLTATTLVAVLFSLVFAKISDKQQRRREFLVVSSLGLGLSLGLAAFAIELWVWFAAMVLVGFFRSVFSPFPLAVLLDKKKDLRTAMYGRELIFNTARFTLAVASVGIYLVTGSVRVPLMLTGLCAIAFAIAFEFSKKKKLDVK